jgi:3-methyladenine DNA glycosylase/8-oxoguanine DNA glycosylase
MEGRLRAAADLRGAYPVLIPDEAAIARLRELRGVGRWTAEYVLLRGSGGSTCSPVVTWGPETICRPGCTLLRRSITTGLAARRIAGDAMAV